VDDSGSDTCHHYKGDMWHIHMADVVDSNSLYDTWQVQRHMTGLTPRQIGGPMVFGHMALVWVNGKVRRGPDMGCHVAPIRWLMLLQNFWTLQDLNPRPPGRGEELW
jgi:hypothetical protein